uniref:Protein kinase domain-containing protein n=1 Tax=Panagrolaimus sp. JU765 TaxID=591449 RepID=A0AC34R090_9BILA
MLKKIPKKKNVDDGSDKKQEENSEKAKPVPVQRSNRSIPAPPQKVSKATQATQAPEKNENSGSDTAKKRSNFASNEVEGLEAEKPVNFVDGRLFNEGTTLVTSQSTTYQFLQTTDADFGMTRVLVVGSNPPECRTLTFEALKVKVRRIQVQATIMALATALSKKDETHFLRLIHMGHSKDYKFLVTEEHGPTLAELLVSQGRVFTTGTALKLGFQTLQALSELHRMGYVCRDVKPQVFIVGKGLRNNRVFLINSTLGRRFANEGVIYGKPRPFLPFFGTVRYASRRAHMEQERGRPDDLESWIYMLGEFFGERFLPWQKLNNKKEILGMKQTFMTPNGFQEIRKKFANFPNVEKFVAQLATQNVEDEPNYRLISDIIYQILQRNGYLSKPFEWEEAATANNTAPKPSEKKPSPEIIKAPETVPTQKVSVKTNKESAKDGKNPSAKDSNKSPKNAPKNASEKESTKEKQKPGKNVSAKESNKENDKSNQEYKSAMNQFTN